MELPRDAFRFSAFAIEQHQDSEVPFTKWSLVKTLPQPVSPSSVSTAMMYGRSRRRILFDQPPGVSAQADRANLANLIYMLAKNFDGGSELDASTKETSAERSACGRDSQVSALGSGAHR
jgi:hypothetical protein